MPLPIPGLQASAYAGVATFHGVVGGDIPLGDPAAPKNTPEPTKI